MARAPILNMLFAARAAALLALPVALANVVDDGSPRSIHELLADDGGGADWREARAEIAAILTGREHHRVHVRRTGHAHDGSRGHRHVYHSHHHVHHSALRGNQGPPGITYAGSDGGGGEEEAEMVDEAEEKERELPPGVGVDPVTGELCDTGDDPTPELDEPKRKRCSNEVPVADGFGQVHPAVGKQLAEQADAISALREEQERAEELRGRFEDVAGEAQVRMGDSLEVQRVVDGLRAEYDKQCAHATELQLRKSKLAKRHEKLVKRIHEIMEPRLIAAQTRLDSRRSELDQAAQLVQDRNVEREQRRVDLLEALTAEKEAKISLAQAEEVAAEAERARSAAAEKLRESKRGMSGKQEALRFARTRVEASLTQQRRSEERLLQANQSVENLQEILLLEEQKLEESFAHSLASLNDEAKAAKAHQDEAKANLDKEKEKYAEWQREQQRRLKEAAAHKAKYNEQQEEYMRRRDEIKRKAEERAGAPYGGKTSRDEIGRAHV